MRQYHHIVLTCGISFFGAYNLFRQGGEEGNFIEYAGTNPMPAQGLSEEDALLKWQSHWQTINLSSWAGESPKKISAEYSLLHALQKAKRLGDSPRVVFIHTDSFGGRAAVTVLAPLCRADFNAHVTCQEVADIDPNDRERLQRSLGGYMQIVAASLEEGDADFTCFAPLGGYKVMTALGYVAGAYMGFPTLYIHEDNQGLHEIPPVPVRVDIDALAKTAPLMRRLRNTGDKEWAEISKSEQNQVKQNGYFFERFDTLVGINAFGRFVMDRPEHQELFGPRVQVSFEAERSLLQSNQAEWLCRHIRELLKKLKTDPVAFRNELGHDAVFKGVRLPTFSLYKGTGRGVVFRAAYLFDDEAEELFINRIWTDHDAYERDVSRGIGLCENFNGIEWVDITGRVLS